MDYINIENGNIDAFKTFDNEVIEPFEDEHKLELKLRKEYDADGRGTNDEMRVEEEKKNNIGFME